eukprot:COSAG05_NODE_514_length_9082_cov_6.915730_6_plen_654_part_00
MEKESKKKRKKKKVDGDKKLKQGSKTSPNPILIDESPRNPAYLSPEKQGQEMVGAIRNLYIYLRKEGEKKAQSGVRDTYGLWLQADGSDADEEDDDTEVLGVVKLDAKHMDKQANIKKAKKAVRVGNVEYMSNEELQEELQRRELSTKGDKDARKARLTAAFDEEARAMQSATRHVMHFNSPTTKRNIEMLVAKVNRSSHGRVQNKLKEAHEEVARLSKLHEVVTAQELQLMENDATISSLQARVAELEALKKTMDVATAGLTAGGNVMGGHTIASFTKVSRTVRENNVTVVNNDIQRLDPWDLAKIAQQKNFEGGEEFYGARSVCTVLVIDSISGINWNRAFKQQKTRDGRLIRAVHSSWHLINVASTSHFGGYAICDVLTSEESTSTLTRIMPECVLVRDSCKSVHGEDHSHQLLGFMHAGVPCVNSAQALLQCIERPIIYAALLGIRNQQGVNKDGSFKFPLIQQDYFANESPSPISNVGRYPLMTKLSTVHRGFGKFRCRDAETFTDLSSMISLSRDYYTTEPLLEGIRAEIQILQLGKQVRAYRKSRADGQTFRTWDAWGSVHYDDIKMESRWSSWASEVSKLFGGLDMFSLSVLVDAAGEEFIIGIHTTDYSLADQHINQDATAMTRLVAEKVAERQSLVKNFKQFP